MFLDCLANLILPNILSWHYLWDPYGGFGHDGRRIQPVLPILTMCNNEIFGCLGQGFELSPSLPRYVNVPGLFGQPNIANILSWHSLWDPYGGFGHDGRRIQPVLPILTMCNNEIFGCLWTKFRDFTPLPRYVNVPGLFGQPNIDNILSWHYRRDPYGGFGHDGRRIQPVLPSLQCAITKYLAVYGPIFGISPTSKICKCSWIVWPT